LIILGSVPQQETEKTTSNTGSKTLPKQARTKVVREDIQIHNSRHLQLIIFVAARSVMIRDVLISMTMALFLPFSLLSGMILAAVLCTSLAIVYTALSSTLADAEQQLSSSDAAATPILSSNPSIDSIPHRGSDVDNSIARLLTPSTTSIVLLRPHAKISDIFVLPFGESSCWHTGRFHVCSSTASVDCIRGDVTILDVFQGLLLCHHIRGRLRLTSLSSVGDSWSPDPG
jgi:hypothetical protein